jgi:acyl-CoA thioesterase FadM
VGKKSAVLKQTVFFKSTDQVVVDADVTFVVADANTGKALSFDGQLRSELDRFAH